MGTFWCNCGSIQLYILNVNLIICHALKTILIDLLCLNKLVFNLKVSLVSCIVCLLQREPSGGVCVPVLCGRRCDAVLPAETVRYLHSVKICESLLLWKEDVDLVKLHHTRKLSLTLLRDGLLDR